MLMDMNPSDHFPVWRDLDTGLCVISSHLCIQAVFPFLQNIQKKGRTMLLASM